MRTKIHQGLFTVIDSFAIKRRSEFYLIGESTEGLIQSGWFVNISLNPSLAITCRIKTIEDVDLTFERNCYKLIVIDSNEEDIDLLIGLNIRK